MGSVYVNFIPDDEARVPEAYGRNYERLAGIKRKFETCPSESLRPEVVTLILNAGRG